MTESIHLPPWPHKITYEEFMEKLIQITKEHCERNFGFGLLPHHKRLITYCNGKDLPALNVLYKKYKHKRNFAKDFESAMAAEESFFIIECITNCVLAAYNVQVAPKRLKPQHVADAMAILENTSNDSGLSNP